MVMLVSVMMIAELVTTILTTSGVCVRELHFWSRNSLTDSVGLLDSITEEPLNDHTEGSGWLS